MSAMSESKIFRSSFLFVVRTKFSLRKESVTFDPFTSLSVPLLKRTAIDVIVLYRTDEKPPTKFRVILQADGTVGELKHLVSVKCGLPPHKVRLSTLIFPRLTSFRSR